MQLKHESIDRHVEGTLRPIYLVAGDEALLVEETCDAIIGAARQQGYTERSVHFAEGNFNWSEIVHDSASISLFAERKVVDVRVRGNKFDREGSAIIRSWIERADGETLLLIRCGRLDGGQRKSAWFKAIEKAGAVCLIWDMNAAELPRWITARLQRQQLKADSDAISYLCGRVEGNLLAADQEVRKLALLDPAQPIQLQDMVSALEDVSRFTPFDLINAAMLGDGRRTRRILQALQEERISPMAIVMPLISQLRETNPHRLPPASRDAVEAFRARIRDASPVLAECAYVDQQIRGQLPGDAWLSLSKLMLRLGGLRQITLASEDADAIA